MMVFLLISKYLPFLLDKHWSILFVWILNSNTYLFCSNANLNPYIFVFNLCQFIPFQPHLNTPSSFIIHKYLLNSFYPSPMIYFDLVTLRPFNVKYHKWEKNTCWNSKWNFVYSYSCLVQNSSNKFYNAFILFPPYSGNIFASYCHL